MAAVRRVPALLDHLARGRQHDEASVGQPVEEGVDQLEYEVVGPVQVGQHHDHGSMEREAVGVGDHRRGGLLAGPDRLDAAKLRLVAHQVEEALVDAVDLRGAGPFPKGDAHRRAGHLDGLVSRVAGADAGPVAQSVCHRPPDVGLAIGHAATLEDEGVVVGLGVDGQLLGQAGLADASLPQQEQQSSPGVEDGVLDAVAEQPELRFPADEPGPVALRSIAGWSHCGIGPPGGHQLLAALGIDGLQGLVAHDTARGGEGGSTHEHVAGLGSRLQSASGVHHVAHGGVVAAGP